MKKDEQIVTEYSRKMRAFVALIVVLFFLFISVFFTSQIFAESNEKVKTKKQEILYKNKNPIDLDDILQENEEDNITEQLQIEEIDMEYTTRYQNNNDLAQGVIQVLQEGRVGKKNAVVIKKYINGELTSEQQVAENIIKAPVERVVEIGTGSMYNSYSVNVGDNAYVVSNSVAIRLVPDENGEKICTLNKNDEIKILKIENDWCFISNTEIKGYLPKNCITTKNPKEEKNDKDSKYSKQQLLANLKFDMDLRKPSNFSLEQFKKVLSGNSNDKNKIFEQNAEYFYYIEKQYNINGIFVASVGIHESAWGTSTISNNKKNLFGYGAVDSNPYGGAYSFNSYSEGIDLLGRVFVKYYLNPNGTKIYDGTITDGKFYSGSTLSAVNSKYASDKNWANCVYKWMEYLYNRL